MIGGRLRWLTDNTSFDKYVSFSEICDFAIDNSNPKGDSQFPDKKQFYKKNCMTFFDLRTSSKLTDTPIFFPKCTLFRAASYYYYDYSHFECKKTISYMVFFIGCRLISLNGIQISEKENVYVHNLLQMPWILCLVQKVLPLGVMFYYDY